jgi:hypothetical protein
MVPRILQSLLRVERVRRAFNMKCPKLKRCKEDGARTLLVLETNDISLTNHMVVGEAVRTVRRCGVRAARSLLRLCPWRCGLRLVCLLARGALENRKDHAGALVVAQAFMPKLLPLAALHDRIAGRLAVEAG